MLWQIRIDEERAKGKSTLAHDCQQGFLQGLRAGYPSFWFPAAAPNGTGEVASMEAKPPLTL